MAKCVAAEKSAKLVALRARLHSTNGGSSDTEENELTVKPTRRPSVVHVVTTVTPVANWPSARRKSRASKRPACGCAAFFKNVSASAGSMNQGNRVRGASKPLMKGAGSDV